MPVLFLVFFLSGAAGLAYQIVWGRLLVLALGATTEAFAITVASFMGGLGLGAGLAGGRADRLGRPVRAYALLEGAIAAAAAAVPAALEAARPAYIAAEAAGLPGARLAITAAILLVPTTLMGTTLPVLARLARERAGRDVALLYGANTLGATVGCLAAGFALIEILGLRGTAALAVAANLAAAAGALLLDRLPSVSIAPAVGAGAEAEPPRRLAGVFFATGFLSLALEIVWTRLLLPRTGSETYVYTAILSAYLGGIGAGSIAYAAVERRLPPARAHLGLVLSAAGAGVVGAGALASGVLGDLPYPLVVAALVPSTFAMGWAFPVGIALATPAGRDAAAPTGRLYAWNTLGGIAGALAAPYLLAPTLGSGRAVGAIAASYIALGAALVAGEDRRTSRLVAAAAAIVLAGLSVGTPAFRHPVFARIERHPFARLLEHREDRVAAVTAGVHLVPRPDGTASARPFLLVNGIGMTQKTVDAKMMTHLPLLLHPAPRRVLVLCFGMGTAFRSALSHPADRVGTVEVVDLVPTVPTFMRHYHADAAAVLADPRAHVVVDDARHFLETPGGAYDVVSSDPPPPISSAGTSILYSREFYEAGRRRLAPGGLFVQWLPFDGATVLDYLAHVRTFLSVFPHVSAWRAFDRVGFYLVGSDSPIAWDPQRAAAALADARVRADLGEWTPSLCERPPGEVAAAIGGLLVADDSALRSAIFAGPIITDDRPLPEYPLLRRRLGWDPSPWGTEAAVLCALGVPVAAPRATP